MTKLPLLLLPGWGMEARVWQPLLSGLREVYELIAVDWQTVTTVAGYQIMVRETIDTRIRGEFAIFGWSLGSLVALEVAPQYPATLRQLLLCSATARFTQDRASRYAAGWAPRIVERMLRNLKRDCRATLAAFDAMMFTSGETAAGELGKFLATVRTAQVELATLVTGLEYLIQSDHRAKLPLIQTPTLLIHGAADQICPVAAGEVIAAGLGGKSSWRTLPGIGHLPFWSAPEETLRLIKEFNHESSR